MEVDPNLVVRNLQERVSALCLEVAMWQARSQDLEAELNTVRLELDDSEDDDTDDE